MPNSKFSALVNEQVAGLRNIALIGPLDSWIDETCAKIGARADVDGERRAKASAWVRKNLRRHMLREGELTELSIEDVAKLAERNEWASRSIENKTPVQRLLITDAERDMASQSIDWLLGDDTLRTTSDWTRIGLHQAVAAHGV